MLTTLFAATGSLRVSWPKPASVVIDSPLRVRVRPA